MPGQQALGQATEVVQKDESEEGTVAGQFRNADREGHPNLSQERSVGLELNQVVGITQLVEYLFDMEGAVGSSPTIHTKS